MPPILGAPAAVGRDVDLIGLQHERRLRQAGERHRSKVVVSTRSKTTWSRERTTSREPREMRGDSPSVGIAGSPAESCRSCSSPRSLSHRQHKPVVS